MKKALVSIFLISICLLTTSANKVSNEKFGCTGIFEVQNNISRGVIIRSESLFNGSSTDNYTRFIADGDDEIMYPSTLGLGPNASGSLTASTSWSGTLSVYDRSSKALIWKGSLSNAPTHHFATDGQFHCQGIIVVISL